MTAEELLQNSASAREELEETERLSELLQQLPVEPAPKDLVHAVIRQAERQTLIPTEDAATSDEPFFNRRRVFTIAKSLLVTSAMLGFVMFLMQQTHDPMVKEHAVATNDFGLESESFEEVALDRDGDGIVDESSFSFAESRIRNRIDGATADERPMPESSASNNLAMDAMVTKKEAEPGALAGAEAITGTPRGISPESPPMSDDGNGNTTGFGHISNGFSPRSNAGGMAHVANTAQPSHGILSYSKPVTVAHVVKYANDNGLGQSGKWEVAQADSVSFEAAPLPEWEDDQKSATEKANKPNVKGLVLPRNRRMAQGVDKAKLSNAVAGDIVMSLCSNGDNVIPVELTVVDVQKSAGQVNYLFAQNGIPLAADEENVQYSMALSDKGAKLRRSKLIATGNRKMAPKPTDGKPDAENKSELDAKTLAKDSAKDGLNDDLYVLYVEAPAPNVIAALASLEQQETVTNLSLNQTISTAREEVAETERLYSELKKNSEVVRQQYYDRNADFIPGKHYSEAQSSEGGPNENRDNTPANEKNRFEGKDFDLKVADTSADDSRFGKKGKPGRPKESQEEKVKTDSKDIGKDSSGTKVAGSGTSSKSSTDSRRYKFEGITKWVKDNTRYVISPVEDLYTSNRSVAANQFAVPVEQQVAQQKLAVAFQMPVEFDDELQRDEFIVKQQSIKSLASSGNQTTNSKSSPENPEIAAVKTNPQLTNKNKLATISDLKNQPVTSPVRLLIVMRGNPMAARQPMN